MSKKYIPPDIKNKYPTSRLSSFFQLAKKISPPKKEGFVSTYCFFTNLKGLQRFKVGNISLSANTPLGVFFIKDFFPGSKLSYYGAGKNRVFHTVLKRAYYRDKGEEKGFARYL